MTLTILPNEFHHFHVHHDWSFDRWGGSYGVIELEGFSAADPSDIVYETAIMAGPAQLMLPVRAGTAGLGLVVTFCCIAVVVWIVHRWKKHDRVSTPG